MDNINHEDLQNFSGLLRTIFLIEPSKAPVLVIENDTVINSSQDTGDGSITGESINTSFFNSIDVTMDTLSFKEEQVIASGDDAYKKSISGVIPKNRTQVLSCLRSWHRKRAIVVCIDRNGQAFTFGSKSQPAVITFSRSNGPTADDRNQFDLLISHTSKEPASFCSVTE